MTQSNDDPPTLWLKQVPKAHPTDDAVWASRILPDHKTVGRSSTRPTETVDAPAMTRLVAAVNALRRDRYDPEDPLMLELHQAEMGLATAREKERKK